VEAEAEVDKLAVLLATHESGIELLLKRALGRNFSQLTLIAATSEEDFYRQLQKSGLDAVVLDGTAPWLKVPVLVSTVRTTLADCPLVLLTTPNREAEAVQSLRLGLDIYILETPGYMVRLESAILGLLSRSRSRAQSARLERRLNGLLQSISVGVFRTTADGEILEANPAFLQMLGFQSLLEAQGVRFHELFVSREDHVKLLAQMRQHGHAQRLELQLRRMDGETIWVRLSQTLGSSRNGQMLIDGLIEDISQFKQTQQKLDESVARFDMAAKGAVEGFWDWDLRTGNMDFSGRWKEILGYNETEIGNGAHEWFGRVHPDDREALQAAIDIHVEGRSPVVAYEHRLKHKDGSYIWVACRGLAFRSPDGTAIRLTGTLVDITDRKTGEEQIRHDAAVDGLTGLPNRFLFLDRLQAALERSKRDSAYGFTVLLLDLDRFQFINDSLGHIAGDELLVAVAKRLKGCLRTDDVLARLGGDEFGILAEHVRGSHDSEGFALRIQGEFKEAFNVSGHEVYATCSTGIASSDHGYESHEQILRDADTALNKAKSRGRARHEIFDASMHDRAVQLLQTENDLRKALERRELRIHYQPIVSMVSGKIAGFEALLRWQHPKRGLVLPEEFIPVAEETGLIVPIAKWVLAESCRQTSAWQSSFPSASPITVSVNLSSRNLAQPDLIEQVNRALFQAGLQSGSLGIEITEGTIVENSEAAIAVLSSLRALNVRVQIDDFGTGYSSLSYLHQFPIDALKIDRSFISGIGRSSQNMEIVRTIVALAKNLGLVVVAEGVETAEEADLLRGIQCDFAQGFYFHGPVEPNAAAVLLGRERGSPN
jgi:diguanylate cyclase (GGDEF)-like protein/PAS domain S-box-containing protein